MAVDNKFERCHENDPNRCQGITKGQSAGQCPYRAVENSKFCPMHGGSPRVELNRKAEVARYRLGQYQSRMEEFSSDTEIKNLREEIGIVRMVLENVITQCKSANQLLLYSTNIQSLVGQVANLIKVAQSLEEKNNNLLDRKVVIVIADSIVTIVGEYINDPDKLNEVGTRICESIINAASPTNTARIVSQGDNAA